MDLEVSRRKFDADIQALQGDAAAYAAARGWTVVSTAYPVLGVLLVHPRSKRGIEFRFTCDQWDELAPSLALHNASDGRELSWKEWPQGGWAAGEHPNTGKPFLCLPGIREYHTHPSHIDDKWEGYRLRGSYRLRDIIDRVQQKFEAADG